jgi:uncharacterized protein YpuA (DUF1002 family)
MSSISIYKTCATCGDRKLISEFNRIPHKLGYESNCKSCQKIELLNPRNDVDFVKTEKELVDTARPLDVPFPEKTDVNKTINKVFQKSESDNIDYVKTEKELIDTSTPLVSQFPEKTDPNKTINKVFQKEESHDISDEVAYVKTEKELINTSMPLTSPFPEKNTNRTTRKIRI